MPTSQLAVACLVAAGLFAAAAVFTRARPLVLLAALVAGALAAWINIEWDVLAHARGWWRYADGSETASPLAYLAVGLAFGGAAGLVGRSATGRWGPPGLLGFLATFALLGVVRDSAYDAAGGVFAFGPGLAPRLADAAGWLSLAAAAQLAIRIVAGPEAATAKV